MAYLTRAFSNTRPPKSPTIDNSPQARLQKAISMRQQRVMRQPSTIQISAPVLLSTTNVQTLNAPDVATAHRLRKAESKLSISSHSSKASDKDSDTSSVPSRSRGDSITDNSSVGSAPSSPKPGDSPSHYFASKSPSPPRKAKSSVDLQAQARNQEPLPPLPTRAPTHSKVAHQQLAKKRSLQTLNAPGIKPVWQSPPRSVPEEDETNRETRLSADIFRSHQTNNRHPFGKELEQVDEVAEDFERAMRDAARQQDEEVMQSRGLKRFCADDYLRDLSPIFNHYFLPQPIMVGWI